VVAGRDKWYNRISLYISHESNFSRELRAAGVCMSTLALVLFGISGSRTRSK
jgi:hypothetical protein